MGMFDYVRCDMPLPSTAISPPEKGWSFQSKDTPEQRMTLYIIRGDGRLVEEDRDGTQTVVPDYHGDLYFYTGNHPDVGWWEYKARFSEGALLRIDLVEFRAPEGRNRNAEIDAARSLAAGGRS